MGRRQRQVQPRFGPERAFGEVLREIRKELRLSQERLALDCGFDRTFVSRLERGLTSPTFRTIVKLAKFANTRPYVIVRRAEESHFFRS